ncbi:CinA family nicotinamide mononucleotide deamidase-related protein [Actinomadura alba]|uniref:CinA-like protein n=1 Tax=Actinomadura alba TaxID=406431 RepID=A0ABR7LGV0_9ACTN|nr:CinA family nicotinamide mononucleotide deamidase-related protein [Actinomadura alba]MBC6464057.1 CinA family nicotinamide mononucleotide deamidase-related protein [Actinomadura alba]
MRVELLTVGDELLLGDTVNGNAAWLGQRLAAIGVEVTRSVVVGDGFDPVIEATQDALSRADAVIITGGLGPTYDDLTRDALAKAAGVRLLSDPALEQRLRERAVASGRPLRPMALRMAEVPEGATLLANPVGSAPGLRMELPGGVAYALPGVPHEMHAIMTDLVLPELRGRVTGDVPVRRTLRTAGVWESVLATRLAPVEALDGVRLAYLPDPAEVKIRITASGPDAQVLLGEAEELIRDLLGTAVYGAEDDTLDRVVHRLLAERSANVAVAESLTGGLLGAELTLMAGSSATFAGGIVAYATELKESLLGVPRELLDRQGAVDPEVALAMASGVRERLGASYGLAVTGVAGPTPQDGRPVGTIHVAVAGPGGTSTVESPVLPVRGSDGRERPLIRRMTVVHALDLLRRQILGAAATHEWSGRRGDREETT